NARIQGADRVYRTGMRDKGRRQSVAMRLAVMALGTLALNWFNETAHEEAYNALPLYDRMSYWHIGPGTDYHTRIPFPFELGTIGAAFPVVAYDAIKHQVVGGYPYPDQTWDQIMFGITQAMGLDPIPQAILPLVED